MSDKIKIEIIVTRNGKSTRYKKNNVKKGEAFIGRISDFMVKVQEDAKEV